MMDVQTMERLYPDKIVGWEMAHNIIREERGGMVYIRCLNFDEFTAKVDRETEKRRNAERFQAISDAQAEAYFGGGA